MDFLLSIKGVELAKPPESAGESADYKVTFDFRLNGRSIDIETMVTTAEGLSAAVAGACATLSATAFGLADAANKLVTGRHVPVPFSTDIGEAG